ncbi:MAG TPA: TIGR03862 family flavoprotein, partial [Burkholderiales bacterium]
MKAIVIGAGPSGLMAAEVLAAAGIHVDVFDAMPSVGRKFLMAGKGGLNLTHAEAPELFAARYGSRRPQVEALLRDFGPATLREWVRGLGVDTFVGSSGRIFPSGMKAAPLLRRWLHRLREAGVKFHVRHRWLGWHADGALRFTGPQGDLSVRADAVILALGGGSWSRLGSDAAWVAVLEQRGIAVAPLQPANCGFDIGWSEHFRARYAGQPVKSVVAAFTDRAGATHVRQGECIITDHGIEG